LNKSRAGIVTLETVGPAKIIGGVDIQPVSPDDLDFLAEMTLLAAFPPGPLPAGAAAMPHARRWVEEWGKPGDAGVVAWLDEVRVGAAWCRIHVERVLAQDAYGGPLAELAIAVVAGHRRRGVGGRLLEGLAEEAAAAGHPGLSLTVNLRNPGLALYERAGYRVHERDGDRLVMVKSFDGPAAGGG
jgi:GNAT superfamily N-acetyltransferase